MVLIHEVSLFVNMINENKAFICSSFSVHYFFQLGVVINTQHKRTLSGENLTYKVC